MVPSTTIHTERAYEVGEQKKIDKLLLYLKPRAVESRPKKKRSEDIQQIIGKGVEQEQAQLNSRNPFTRSIIGHDYITDQNKKNSQVRSTGTGVVSAALQYA